MPKKMQHPSVTEANKGKGKKSKKEPKLTEAEKQALATYGYQCEHCGEYHELEDLPEFGAHDEYEEVAKCPDGSTRIKGKPCPRQHKKDSLPPPPITKAPKYYTSEHIPDYIMRALQPKKSEHSVYGKLRY